MKILPSSQRMLSFVSLLFVIGFLYSWFNVIERPVEFNFSYLVIGVIVYGAIHVLIILNGKENAHLRSGSRLTVMAIFLCAIVAGIYTLANRFELFTLDDLPARLALYIVLGILGILFGIGALQILIGLLSRSTKVDITKPRFSTTKNLK